MIQEERVYGQALVVVDGRGEVLGEVKESKDAQVPTKGRDAGIQEGEGQADPKDDPNEARLRSNLRG